VKANPFGSIIIRLILVAIFPLILILSACSDSDPVDVRTNEATDTSDDADGAVDDDSGTTDDDDDPSDDTDDDDSHNDDDDDDDDTDDDDDDDDDDDNDGGDGLPGEPWDGFASAGDLFGVVGVAHDDVLNVREAPDAGSTIIETLDPTEMGVEATGEGRLLPSTIWYQVDTDSGVGWVNARFVAFIGGTDDATAEYIATGSPTNAETMVELADAVADAFIFDPDVGTTVTQTVAPSVGDLAEITYDIIGLGDDAVGGFRLHIFATPVGEGFELKSIERTLLCSRGTAGELCV